MHDSVVKYHSDTYQDCFGVEFVWFLGTVTDTQRCRSAPHPQVSTGDHRRGTQRTGTANMTTPICGVDGPGRMLWILWYTRDQCRTVVFVVRFATECSPEKNHCRPTCGPIQVKLININRNLKVCGYLNPPIVIMQPTTFRLGGLNYWKFLLSNKSFYKHVLLINWFSFIIFIYLPIHQPYFLKSYPGKLCQVFTGYCKRRHLWPPLTEFKVKVYLKFPWQKCS